MNALSVAKQLLAKAAQKRIPVCNLKLQKLLYYSQGYHLAVTKAPLFEEDIEAWDHGPVVNPVYHCYRQNGGFPIVAAVLYEEESVDTETGQIIDFVIEKYARQEAWALRNQTHKEKPWIDHQSPAGQYVNEVIPKEEIQSFFLGQLKTDFDSELASLLDCSEMNIQEAIELPDSVQDSDQFLEWARSFN
ncbi:DUF4065 domain-containing protein [Marinobacter daepoensis]|uniref:SocA family protein n=1 Tax=Marinobacter daepoensis TaxID=262077 RepID=A0ABS3BFT5_9GAMM|nr:type II toxin-antitoxin system antitoxin SocA domain-containing protein [Marinobacter daepoensis]MBN7770471.1 SocA family protein [Marinobacter daepoensis]MBY6079917.1 DUF4065 domain-containing protein [Marinobacter daepoensis]